MRSRRAAAAHVRLCSGACCTAPPSDDACVRAVGTASLLRIARRGTRVGGRPKEKADQASLNRAAESAAPAGERGPNATREPILQSASSSETLRRRGLTPVVRPCRRPISKSTLSGRTLNSIRTPPTSAMPPRRPQGAVAEIVRRRRPRWLCSAALMVQHETLRTLPTYRYKCEPQADQASPHQHSARM